MKKTVMMAALVALSGAAYAGSVYSPSKGVICDKKAKFCTDSYGISIGLTKEYFGNKAANKFERLVEKDHMDMTEWTFSNGVNCNTHKKICKKSKWDDNADAHWTKMLFGTVPHASHGGGKKASLDFSRDCKNYLMDKFPGVPNAASSVGRGYYKGDKVHVPVTFKWDEPRLDEKGECIIKNGVVQRYKAFH